MTEEAPNMYPKFPGSMLISTPHCVTKNFTNSSTSQKLIGHSPYLGTSGGFNATAAYSNQYLFSNQSPNLSYSLAKPQAISSVSFIYQNLGVVPWLSHSPGKWELSTHPTNKGPNYYNNQLPSIWETTSPTLLIPP
ncbi:Hypothetical predicted protein [Pelobates cultripes]|uniref:Uncharacterized protein n=1 Tax=Pelobates cultripes TaxID=61616 RepID=A0AAD1SYN3_PELCU|nr:Hypothetical predicted protein [Pelobates cultripes]